MIIKKRLIFGIIYCLLWYISILVGFFLFICPLLPLVFFHPKLYRKWSEIVFGMWEPFPVALMEIFFGIRAVLTGDQIDPFERSLLIMNHRTRLDWNFLWVGLFHCCHPYSHALKYVLKSAVMYFPGPGWVMQTCSFLFIHRNWARDQRLLERLIQYLDISDEPYQILIFPEGTDLTPSNILKSHKYADEHNLDRYYNVLHPKTTGFAYLAHKMKLSGKINAVYDITVGYPGQAPQNESDLLKGNFPEEVHFHIKRYSAREVPSSESDLKQWLSAIWKKKELLLTTFNKTYSFCPSSNIRSEDNIPAEPQRYGTSSEKITENKMINNFSDKGSNEGSDQSLRTTFSASSVGNSDEIQTDGNFQSSGSFYSSIIDTDVTQNVPDTSTSLRSSSSRLLNRYRPSHLLYLTFLFWIALIYFTTHQFFVNCYVQIWVLVHTLLFSCISFLSDGFQHIIASIYFYRYNIDTKNKDA